MYCTYGAQLGEVCSLERLQGGNGSLKAHLPSCDRGRSTVGLREALLALDKFSDNWDDIYPQISRSWRAHWDNLNTLFRYPPDIRKAIYTTNAIESLNSVIRKAIKKRKLFPTDDAAVKVVYPAVQDASKKWTMLIRNWKSALNRFMIEFEERLSKYV